MRRIWRLTPAFIRCSAQRTRWRSRTSRRRRSCSSRAARAASSRRRRSPRTACSRCEKNDADASPPAPFFADVLACKEKLPFLQ